MDFQPNETQHRVAELARTYAHEKIAPAAADIDRNAQFPVAILQGLAHRGLMAINVPQELGGLGAGAVAYSLAMQEVAKACASTAVTMAVNNMVGEVIARFGTPAQARHHCPRLADGTYVAGSFALSEGAAGSDPGAIRTTARREGDGWVLEGGKQWITSGAYAGVIVVWARTGGAGSSGISCFLVEGGTPGLGIGRAESKLGIRGSNTVSLTFERCVLPLDAQLGELGGGFRIAMMALDGGRIGISAQAIGIARAALARGTASVRNGAARDVSCYLADARTEIEAARLLSLRAASTKERGEPFTREASMAKLYASEMAVRVCNRMLAVHGSEGQLRERAAERHFRDARVTPIYEGTSEIQRLVIARGLLR